MPFIEGSQSSNKPNESSVGDDIKTRLVIARAELDHAFLDKSINGQKYQEIKKIFGELVESGYSGEMAKVVEKYLKEVNIIL